MSSAADGDTIDDEIVRTADDKKLLSAITTTAQKTSYNNCRSHRSNLGKARERFPTAKQHNGSPRASASPTSTSKRSGTPQFCCGTSAVVDARLERNTSIHEPDNGTVLRDPASEVSYSVLNLVGEGGFSNVLLVRAKSGHVRDAEDPSSPKSLQKCNKVYAAKIIPKSRLKSAGESFIKATMLERNILGKFNYPFLLKLYHSFQEHDRLVLVIDYAAGGSLHTHVNIALRETGKPFSESRSVYYVAEIALGIVHLHRHGIIHRDLKLENVLMHADGHCAVSDFGASKRIKPQSLADCAPAEGVELVGNSVAGSPEMTSESTHNLASTTKSIVGTPAYMAPEMLLEQAYDYAVDWWALGVLLFTMLRGKLPFEAAQEDKMLWRIVKSRPHYDPSWTPQLLAVLRLLLQKRPDARLRTLRQLAATELYHDTDWLKIERRQVPPPYVPVLGGDCDLTYVPKRIADAEVAPMVIDYKKGDSMKVLFKKFSHRGSFERS